MLMSNCIPINSLIADARGCVMAIDKDAAYAGFGQGKVLIAFDSPDLLEDFAQKNQAEFYGQIIERDEKGGFRWFKYDGRKTYFTCHRHKIREEYIKQLQKLEDGNHE